MLSAVVLADGSTLQAQPAAPPPPATPPPPPPPPTPAPPPPSGTTAASSPIVDVGFVRGSAGITEQPVDVATGIAAGAPIAVGAPLPGSDAPPDASPASATGQAQADDQGTVDYTGLQRSKPAGVVAQWQRIVNAFKVTIPSQAQQAHDLFGNPKEFFK